MINKYNILIHNVLINNNTHINYSLLRKLFLKYGVATILI
jgi:hypothetical protein